MPIACHLPTWHRFVTASLGGGWRCVTCHPTPTGIAARIYEIDEAAEAAERHRIEDAATPKPQPKPAVTTTDNWWE